MISPAYSHYICLMSQFIIIYTVTRTTHLQISIRYCYVLLSWRRCKQMFHRNIKMSMPMEMRQWVTVGLAVCTLWHVTDAMLYIWICTCCDFGFYGLVQFFIRRGWHAANKYAHTPWLWCEHRGRQTDSFEWIEATKWWLMIYLRRSVGRLSSCICVRIELESDVKAMWRIRGHGQILIYYLLEQFRSNGSKDEF